MDTSGIADDEGMENAVFTSRWMAGGTDIPGGTGSAETTYTDDTVEPEKEYVYKIKAINEHGEVSEMSDWVRGFTPAAPAPAARTYPARRTQATPWPTPT